MNTDKKSGFTFVELIVSIVTLVFLCSIVWYFIWGKTLITNQVSAITLGYPATAEQLQNTQLYKVVTTGKFLQKNIAFMQEVNKQDWSLGEIRMFTLKSVDQLRNGSCYTPRKIIKNEKVWDVEWTERIYGLSNQGSLKLK